MLRKDIARLRRCAATHGSGHTDGQRITRPRRQIRRGHEHRLVAERGHTSDFHTTRLHLAREAICDTGIRNSLDLDSVRIGGSSKPGRLCLSLGVDAQRLGVGLGCCYNAVGLCVCLGVGDLGLDALDLEGTLLVLDLVGVLAVDVGGFDLGLERTLRELVHGRGDFTLEGTLDDG